MESPTVVQPALEGEPGSELVRAYVWQLPVRLTHWVTFFCVLVLAFTGFYLHRPFFTATGESAFTMGTIRFVHILTAFVFTASFLLRMYWMFRGNFCSRWGAFVPIHRWQWRGMREMIAYYSFFRWRPAHRIGHNSLAAIVYLWMFFLMLVQILTGFAMYGQVLNHSIWTTLGGWLPMLINIQYLRLAHYLVMYGFLAFTIHHVYSAVLVSAEERNALIESMFSGFKFVPRRELAGEHPCEAQTRRVSRVSASEPV